MSELRANYSFFESSGLVSINSFRFAAYAAAERGYKHDMVVQFAKLLIALGIQSDDNYALLSVGSGKQES